MAVNYSGQMRPAITTNRNVRTPIAQRSFGAAATLLRFLTRGFGVTVRWQTNQRLRRMVR